MPAPPRTLGRWLVRRGHRDLPASFAQVRLEHGSGRKRRLRAQDLSGAPERSRSNPRRFARRTMTPGAAKATRIQLLSFSTPAMRAFHMSWLAFFVCFFAWFSLAPLMPVIKSEFGLSKDQIANINIAAVGITILVRLVIGPLTDKYGPRRTYSALLVLGAIPVLGVAFAKSYAVFLLFRLLIGAIGASFVITQYHTSVMFAPNVVGTANAASAGWGNSGGGVTQSTMPWVLAAVLGLGLSQSAGWRVSMFVPGVMMLIVAVLYWKFTQDSPEGNYKELRAAGV